jgi:hypothetical protein
VWCFGVKHTMHAQWQQQTVQLRPGWNAVFLEVHPEPAECDALFAGLPIESVWDYNRSADAAQFVQDPSTPIPGTPGWLTWFPPGHALAPQTSLFILRDGRPFLIKLSESAPLTVWTVTGTPSLRRLSWQSGGVNLVGFRVGTDSAPAFESLFAGEAGLSGQPVHRLGADGRWAVLPDLAATAPEAGEAYWVRCVSPATRSGTIVVDAGSSQGLRFGNLTAEQSLRVRNTSADARSITIRVLASAPPPPGQPPLAGPVPLDYYNADHARAAFDWRPLTGSLRFTALPPNAEWNVRLGVRRAGAAPAAAGTTFQSLLEVMDDLGTRWLVPVSTDPLNLAQPAGLRLQGAPAKPNALAGLWVGDVSINAVSQPSHPSDPDRTRPARGDFAFRVILHVDEAGASKLLQHVFVVRKPPTTRPDPNTPGFNIIDQPGRTVLATDESLIQGLVGPGELTGRRISSSAFAFDAPIPLTGEGAFGTSTRTVTITIDYDHPRNPFRHLFHPDHDNLDERFEQKLPEGKETFTVSRAITFEFTAADPLGLDPPGWGDTELGGRYRETIGGLHRRSIQIAGTFRIARVSRTAALNQ